jgi:hypothetical protein
MACDVRVFQIWVGNDALFLFHEHTAMVGVPSAGENDIFEMGPRRIQMLAAHDMVRSEHKTDEYSHQKKNDNQTQVDDKSLPDLILVKNKRFAHGHVSVLPGSSVERFHP